MAQDTYLMQFTDEADWLAFKTLRLTDDESGEEVYKEWVQGVKVLGDQVHAHYWTGIPDPDPENPAIQPGYFVHCMTNGRKIHCQNEVCDPYPLTLPHMFQGGQFFQNNWHKFDN